MTSPERSSLAQLKLQYLEILTSHGLRPHHIPPEAEQAREAAFAHMFKDALRAGDKKWAATLKDVYEQNKELYAKELRHPIEIIIDGVRADVEKSISDHPVFHRYPTANVFVGEFPTGAINAQVMATEHGYIVLINSGLLTLLQQTCNLLPMMEVEAAHASENDGAIDALVLILVAYFSRGDPFFGPKPLLGRFEAFLAHALGSASRRFVVGHEYAHILAGHFGDDEIPTSQLSTPAGSISVIRKRWVEELEADEVSYKLLLRASGPETIDTSVLDKIARSSSPDPKLLFEGVRIKAAIAAPMIVLTLDSLLEDISGRDGEAGHEAESAGSHPPSRLRMHNLANIWKQLPPSHAGYINLAAPLWARAGEIRERVLSALPTAP